jgi:hypothetical protein
LKEIIKLKQNGLCGCPGDAMDIHFAVNGWQVGEATQYEGCVAVSWRHLTHVRPLVTGWKME